MKASTAKIFALPSDKQLALLRKLIKEKLEGEELSRAKETLEVGIDRPSASKWIEKLINMPRLASAISKAGYLKAEDFPLLTNKFYYALLMPDGATQFFHVQTGKDSWQGVLFIKVQQGDKYVNLRGQEAHTAAWGISQDPQAALIAYGQMIGRCGRCNRTLTTEDSRLAGIGPVCGRRIAESKRLKV